MAVGTVIHIGDAHLASADPRNPDRLAALERIIARGAHLADLGQLLAWVWPGDLFDRASTPADRNTLARLVQRMLVHASVIVVPGNHDLPGELDMLRWFDPPVTLIDRPGVIEVPTPIDGVRLAVFGLPYPHRGGLVAKDVAKDQVVPVAQTLLESIIRAGAAELARAAGDGFIPLVVAHVNVAGAIGSTGQPQIGREIELPPALLAHFPSTYVALNHIHKHQVIPGLLHCTEAVYAGSIGRMDFGEMEPKGYVEIQYSSELRYGHVDDRREWSGDRFEWEFQWKFVDLGAPAQVHVTARLEPQGFVVTAVTGVPACATCGGNGLEPEPLNSACSRCGGTAIDPAVLATADVRVRFTYRRSELARLDQALPQRLYAGARSLKVEGVPDRETEVRAPTVVAATTLPEKVRAFFALEGTVWTAEYEAALAGLLETLAGGPADFLAAIERIVATDHVDAPAPAAIGGGLS